MSEIAVFILTKDEELHLQRCIDSIKSFASEIVIIDSGSTDKTLEIADNNNCIVLQRKWTNHADQFNWALENINFRADWILRVDADEYIKGDLVSHFKKKLDPNVNAFSLNRYMIHGEKLIKFGGLFPKKIVRLFKYGKGFYESRLMDEHLVINGDIRELDISLIDHNLNSFSWWIDKHNKYASLEAFEFIKKDLTNKTHKPSQKHDISTSRTKFFKDNIFYKLPAGIRSFAYFFYRYFIKFGFLDGIQGLNFHFFQGFWYRYLVDIKILEFYRRKKNFKGKLEILISDVLDIDITTVKENLYE